MRSCEPQKTHENHSVKSEQHRKLAWPLHNLALPIETVRSFGSVFDDYMRDTDGGGGCGVAGGGVHIYFVVLDSIVVIYSQ